MALICCVLTGPAAADGFVLRLDPGRILAVAACADDGGFKETALLDARDRDAPLLISGPAASLALQDGGVRLRFTDAFAVRHELTTVTAEPMPNAEAALPTLSESADCQSLRAHALERAAATTRAPRGWRPVSADAPFRQPEQPPQNRIEICADAATARNVVFATARSNGSIELRFPAEDFDLSASSDALYLSGDGALIALAGDAIAVAHAPSENRLIIELSAPDSLDLRIIGLHCAL